MNNTSHISYATVDCNGSALPMKLMKLRAPQDLWKNFDSFASFQQLTAVPVDTHIMLSQQSSMITSTILYSLGNSHYTIR